MTISTSAVIRYLKILLISAGAVSLSMAMKACVPGLVYDLSMVWTGFTACLKPPYLYVIINVIILTLVYASRFQQEGFDEMPQLQPGQFQPLITSKIPPGQDLNRLVAVAQQELKPAFEEPVAVVLKDEPDAEVKPVVVNGSIVAENEDDDAVDVETEDFSQFSISPPLEAETGLVLWPRAEKSLVVSPLADHKSTLKASHEGLRLARPKQHETLENTWRMITEGSHAPPTIQLRRSDTFKNASANENENDHAQPRPRNRDALKSRTFKDRTNYNSPKASAAPVVEAGKFRKEPSLSQDELNRRVEAYIKKFNDEMRLQRQQSIQQHMEMINRGAY